jgi:hypothetical protein
MASNIDQAVTNIEAVSKATEEMSTTISDIAENSARARIISEKASTQSQNVHEEMRSNASSSTVLRLKTVENGNRKLAESVPWASS